jgi:formate C-acetyltransferase
MLLFTREAVATLEGLGISQLGHVDRLLGPLYERDVAAGRLTPEEAARLVGIWMLHTDIKFDLENATWPETSTCIQLGGCDENGLPVYNQVTKMFIEEHHRLGLVNPKLNCRYNRHSPDEYLETAGRAILKGHNNFVMINDDVVIGGLMRSGVAEKDARLYVSGGCQETMIEGCGHTEGVAFYASMPRVLDLFLRPDGDSAKFVPVFEKADSFEEFEEQFLGAMDAFFAMVIDQRNIRQGILKDSLVCPLFSATQKGCIENGKDYTFGGARYNFSTVSLIGLGTVADSLYAVKKLVYEDKACTMPELIAALSANWEGWETLHRKTLALPKYGHNQPEADALANDFLARLGALLRKRSNKRGGRYLPSLFVYYHFESFAHILRATPDGRRDFDLISPGAAPGQLKPSRDVTEPVKSMQRVDFTACGGGSCVLDVKLPLSGHMTPELFAAFIRACGEYRCPTLQPNVVSQEELLDARVHPEKHRQLIVRICGLSAYFVALTPQVQEEIIARNLYEG